MVSIMEIMQLCRLCLVKEQVNVPIFDDHDDTRQICSKISSCLPVKVSKEDKLPKKICDGCLYKLELQYSFYNTTANAEKQLLAWIEQLPSMDVNDKNENITNQTPPQATVKEEKVEPVESTNEIADISTDAQSYILQQQQLTYHSDFTYKESQGSNADAVDAAENSDEPIAKRPRRRRRATKPVPPESLDSSDNEDDDGDADDAMVDAMTVTKTEEESESEGDENIDDPDDPDEPEPTKVEAEDDTEQPGPSGLGKGGTDPPFQTHDVHKVSTESIRCDNCGEIFASTTILEWHIKKMHTGDGIGYKCEICQKTFKRRYNLNHHMRGIHERNDDYVCDFCDRSLCSKSALATHKTTHTKVYKYNCDKCDRGYTRLTKLTAHREKVHEQIRFPCALCDRVFTTKQSLELHLATHKPDYVRKEWVCEVCSKVSFSKSSHWNHVKTHQGSAGRHVCEFCGKEITGEKGLIDHRRIHTGEKPFVCGTCDKAFTSKSKLSRHTVTHTNLKSHKCEECGKAFTQRRTLVIHLRQHTGERPFQCAICEKRCISSCALRAHSKSHGTKL